MTQTQLVMLLAIGVLTNGIFCWLMIQASFEQRLKQGIMFFLLGWIASHTCYMILEELGKEHLSWLLLVVQGMILARAFFYFRKKRGY